MNKFSKRSWLVNRFKGLYPEVMEDLAQLHESEIAWLADEINMMITRDELDLNRPEGAQKLTEMVKGCAETAREYPF